MDNLKYFFVW